MNISFIGILPIVYIESKDSWGRARGPVIQLPKDTVRGSPLDYHERFHVKQWYVWTIATFGIGVAISVITGIAVWMAFIAVGIVSGILYNTTMLKTRREIAAYGESVRRGPQNQTKSNIVNYAKLLDSKSYKEHLTFQQLVDRVTEAYHNGKLF